MANLDTVEYVVNLMLRVGVTPAKILLVSRDLSNMFGVSSEYEAVMIVKEYIDKCERNQQC